MKQDDKFTVINIREYLKKNADDEEQFGEDTLRQLLSEFSCERNQDVEDFLKRQAIDFTNKYQAGGMVIFLETNNEDKLLSFYGNNRFQPFDRRNAERKDKEPHELIQLLRLL